MQKHRITQCMRLVYIERSQMLSCRLMKGLQRWMEWIGEAFE